MSCTPEGLGRGSFGPEAFGCRGPRGSGRSVNSLELRHSHGHMELILGPRSSREAWPKQVLVEPELAASQLLVEAS